MFDMNLFAPRHLIPSRDRYTPFVFRECTVGYVAHVLLNRLDRHTNVFSLTRDRVELIDHGLSYVERSRMLDETVFEIYEEDRSGFGMWCPETTPVVSQFGAEPVFDLQRAAVGFFGVLTSGVHLNVFSFHEGMPRLRIARRAAHIASYPGALDQAVAGFLPVGQDPWPKLIEEAAEEAWLTPDIVAAAIPVGSIEFAMDRQPGLQRGAVYAFDLEIESGLRLDNRDDEVECFIELTYKETVQAVVKQQFKFDSSLVALDFLLRHGAIDCRDPNFLGFRAILSGKSIFEAGFQSS